MFCKYKQNVCTDTVENKSCFSKVVGLYLLNFLKMSSFTCISQRLNSLTETFYIFLWINRRAIFRNNCFGCYSIFKEAIMVFIKKTGFSIVKFDVKKHPGGSSYLVKSPVFQRVDDEFFLIGIHSMQGWTATTRHGVTRKRSTKRLRDTGNFFWKNTHSIGVC